MKYLKIKQAIQARGVLVVACQFIAQQLLLHLPVSLLDKGGYNLRAFLLIGYWPNSKNPKTFNEKILSRRKHTQDLKASVIADKWLVRKYVEEKGLGHILNEVYYVSDYPDNIIFDSLPDKFVIKANYSSNMNILVKNKHNLNINKVVDTCKQWINYQKEILKRNPEIHYRKIKPLIIIEKYLACLDSYGLKDYKFWCFSGKVKFINIQFVLNGARPSVMYDRNWNLQPFSTGNKPLKNVEIKKPGCLEEMIKIAEKLSAEFNYVRVDLYCLNDNKIIFGELTYNPGGGAQIFIPRKYDKEIGKLLNYKITN